MWKRLRITILLLVLAFVALGAWTDRFFSTSWKHSIYVTAYAINADRSEPAAQVAAQLDAADLEPVEKFFAHEASRYSLTLERPVRFIVGDPVTELPPSIKPGSNVLSVVLWSLKARYWAWRVGHQTSGPRPTVQLFLLYHDPAINPVLPHSIGLQKGMFGVVNVFADRSMRGSNLVVVAHELLHTLGATDKYDADNQPRNPDGIAEPDRQPLYPQRYAELMAGRIPVSPTQAVIPESLENVLIGPATASEIGWRHKP